jgi:KaiC/GvpD/RAD55 family RecA-like ATPase/predicted hydrocarbon binding protein
MASYLSSGVKGLDGILGGGMLPGNYMFEVEPGAEELAFVAAYLDEGLRRGDFCSLVVYDMPHDDIIEKLTNLGLDIRKSLESGSAAVVDLWSEGKYDSEHTGPILMTDNLNDPNSVLRMWYDLSAVHQAKLDTGKYRGIRIATVSISSQVMNYRFEPSYRLDKIGVTMIRKRKALGLSVFTPAMFDATVTAALEHLGDGIIVMSMKEVKGRFQRFIRVKQSPIKGFYTNEVPYDIVDNKPLLVTAFTEPVSTFSNQLKVEPDGSIRLFGSRYLLADADFVSAVMKYLTNRVKFDMEGAQEEVYNFSKDYGRAKFKEFLASTNLHLKDLGAKAMLDMFAAFFSTSGIGILKLVKFSDSLITFSVNNCVCGGNKVISRAIDAYLRGVIAGAAESLLNVQFKCRETRCLADGEDCCEFECQLVR